MRVKGSAENHIFYLFLWREIDEREKEESSTRERGEKKETGKKTVKIMAAENQGWELILMVCETIAMWEGRTVRAQGEFMAVEEYGGVCQRN